MNTNNNYFINIESFSDHFLSLNGNFFNIMSVNIRSISSVVKFNAFKSLVAQLPILPNVIAIQETWFQSDLTQIYKIPGYNAVHCCRFDGYGGTTLYIRENILYTTELCESKHFIEAIRITLDNFYVNGKPLRIATFYRSQRCDSSHFLQFLEDILSSRCNGATILFGDANIDLLDPNYSLDLCTTLSCLNFEPCHTLITRPNSAKCLDHVYSNVGSCLSSDSFECSLSDHNIIWTKLQSEFPCNNYTTKSYKYSDIESIAQEFESFANSLNHCGNPSIDTAAFVNRFSDIIEQNTVVKETRVLAKSLLTPWINKNLQSLMRYKEKLLAKRRKCGRNSRNDFLLKNISRIIKVAERKCMNKYIHGNIEALNANTQKTWKFLNECLGRKEKAQCMLRDANDQLITDEKTKCDMFNNYFLSVPILLKRQISRLQDDSCNKLCTLTQCNSTFSFDYTNNDEVLDIINNLQSDKSPGHDNISIKAIKRCKDTASEHICKIFNTMVNTSIFPEVLKVSKVVPIPKKSCSQTINEFRPIALLSCIDKILEKLMHTRIYGYLTESQQLYANQFGFKNGSGTQDAVVNVVNFICKGLDDKFGGVGAIFYDLSKAFDLIDHDILLAKLPFYGFQNGSLQLLESYIRNRRQYVEINGVKSDTCFVQHGVPQGSVLGPLLFTIYMNDIPKLKLYGKLFLYADDILLLYPYHHEVILKSQMEHDAAIIAEFCRINRLVLNSNKTKIIRFRPHCTIDDNFHIRIGNSLLYESRSVKYLGIHLQSNLSWDLHIQNIKSKVAPAIGILYKYKNKFDIKTNFLIYNSLIHSHLNYMSIMYGYKKSGQLKSLQRIQNKALRNVYNLPRTYSTISLYEDFAKGILPIHGLYKMQMLIFMFKSVRNLVAPSIIFHRNQSTFNTRNSSNLEVARCRLELTKQRIEHSGCSEFNHLPQQLKNILRISKFKTELKAYLLNNVRMLLM